MALKETLQEIIIEHQQLPLMEIVQRDIAIERIPRKATTLIGIRRCGKTTVMLQREKEILSQGISRKAICFIDFSDDRLIELRHGQPGIVADAYYSLYPEMENQKVFFFFDEIENLNSWEHFVNRLMNTRQCEINITGSSAKLLEREVSTVMGGRKMSWHLYPYSFAEYLRAKAIDSSMPSSEGGRALLLKAFREYMTTGGFPESLMFSPPNVTRYLQDTANDIVFRDIIERYKVTNTIAVKIMMTILAGQMSSKLSTAKLYQRLRGMQIRTSKEATGEYLSYFVDAFFVVLVPIRSYSIAQTNTNEKKVYLADHSFAKALSPQKLSPGLILENIVAIHLIRLFGEDKITYGRTPRGYEIDFVIGPDDGIILIQVCLSLDNEEIREREIRALKDAIPAFHPIRSYIVTLEESEIIDTEEGSIEIIPAWKFLLFTDLQQG